MSDKVIGVIGGSGLYEMEGLRNVKEVKVKTPSALLRTLT